MQSEKIEGPFSVWGLLSMPLSSPSPSPQDCPTSLISGEATAALHVASLSCRLSLHCRGSSLTRANIFKLKTWWHEARLASSSYEGSEGKKQISDDIKLKKKNTHNHLLIQSTRYTYDALFKCESEFKRRHGIISLIWTQSLPPPFRACSPHQRLPYNLVAGSEHASQLVPLGERGCPPPLVPPLPHTRAHVPPRQPEDYAYIGWCLPRAWSTAAAHCLWKNDETGGLSDTLFNNHRSCDEKTKKVMMWRSNMTCTHDARFGLLYPEGRDSTTCSHAHTIVIFPVKWLPRHSRRWQCPTEHSACLWCFVSAELAAVRPTPTLRQVVS